MDGLIKISPKIISSMAFEKFTEEESSYHDLEKMSTREILTHITRRIRRFPM